MEYAEYNNYMKLRRRVSKLKASAKQRNIPIRLMAYEYESLLSQGCHYCGTSLVSQNGTCLDRLDSNKGYTLQNVVPCCGICNRAKGVLSFDEFVSWIEKAYKFQQNILNNLQQLNNIQNYSYREEKEERKKFKNKENNYFIGYVPSDDLD